MIDSAAAAKAAAWDHLWAAVEAMAPHDNPNPAAEALLDKILENRRLREALTWATGFIRCAHPKAEEQYPDMRNALALTAGTRAIHTGEFQLTRMRYELATEQLTTVCRMLRHGSGGRIVRVKSRSQNAKNQARRWLALVPYDLSTHNVVVCCEGTDQVFCSYVDPARFDEVYEEDTDHPFREDL